MKLQTPLDSHISNCLVGPYYPIGGYWGERPSFGGQYFPEPNLPSREDNLPHFGHITTSPHCDDKINDYDKQVWFPEPDGAYKFELEVPRYSKDDISVEIEDDGLLTLLVRAKNQNNQLLGEYVIPFPHILDLEHSSAKVENGLLTIFFPAKIVAVKTIKVL